MTNLAMRAMILAVIASFSTVLAGSAMAETPWEKSHPRRDQVNDRLANQNRRINDEVREGEMSQWRADRLHRDDHQIRQEERLMASQNHGHITRQEQRTLNQQENRVSQKIGS